ncbi:hypothetical protein BD769DRAFT_1630676 [Suillus cothurnatus]|nr:hypothetical protein BD769DRAFT_1630676 [Suillus cothurnatus]
MCKSLAAQAGQHKLKSTIPVSSTTGTCHPGSGYVFGTGKNMLDRLEDDKYAYQQKINHYYPFHDEGEWELGKFLQLFSDPIFVNHMTFIPHHVDVGNQCEYGDYMSTDMAWKIQDHLPIGATQVPIILESDKTPMHPIFIIIGNIDLEVPWRCIAYMLIVKFRVHPDYQSILQAWLWHRCMDLVCDNLKAVATEGCFMPDPFRFIHYVFTPLVAHVCNLPEATMIAAVAKNASPLTMAMQEQFGDEILHLPPAKALNLSGVHMPYWRDWIYVCPSIFLASEILHRDH